MRLKPDQAVTVGNRASRPGFEWIDSVDGPAVERQYRKDRPAITYLLEGEVIYHQEGKADQVAHPGGGFAEGRATTHWAENRGSVPAVWIAVDIPK